VSNIDVKMADTKKLMPDSEIIRKLL